MGHFHSYVEYVELPERTLGYKHTRNIQKNCGTLEKPWKNHETGNWSAFMVGFPTDRVVCLTSLSLPESECVILTGLSVAAWSDGLLLVSGISILRPLWDPICCILYNLLFLPLCTSGEIVWGPMRAKPPKPPAWGWQWNKAQQSLSPSSKPRM
jgi:hypothetical protein